MNFDKRITLFLGHYGSGKTNISINYALWLKQQGKNTTIYDLDIVNPYFRTMDGKSVLDKAGIKLVASVWANSSVDLPSINPATRALLDDENSYAVVDVGGDDRGAFALGRYEEGLLAGNDFEMLLVVNKFRPETKTVQGAIQIMHEIETACRLKFTGIVNNSNLGIETTKDTVLDSLPFIAELEKETGLKTKFTTVERNIFEEIAGKIENVMPIDLLKYGNW